MLFIFAIAAMVAAILIYISAKKRYAKSEISFALVGIFVSGLIAVTQIFTVIPAGHVGVVDFLGNVSDLTLKSGINLVNPIAKVVKFSIKTQEIKENMNVPSKEGLAVQLEISVLYSMDPENAAKLYKEIGENYRDVILAPHFRSVVRGITSKYEARSLYTAERESLQGEIRNELSKIVQPRGIRVESCPMRQIVLPAGLTVAIEEKLKAEQESQRMTFILRKEEQEAERKRIEAKGIADFQEIVSKGISSQLLQWKGIEATEKLANSNNSKIVIIGSGKNGLPIILGN